MARIRTIKPSFFLDDKLADLPLAARLLFVGLWCLADREGRLEDRPRRIKAEVFPYDDLDVEEMLVALAAAGFIERYEVDNVRYIQVIKFKKHQRINKRESDSTIPPPPAGHDKPDTCVHAEEDTCTHVGKGREGKGKEGKGNASTPLRSVDACAEPSRAKPAAPPADGRDRDAAEDADPPVITLPTNKRGNEYPVTQAQVVEWAGLYPAVDVLQELRKMRGWLMANKTRRKTARGMPKFANAWLAKEQDRGGANKTRASPSLPTGNGRGLAAAVFKFGERVKQREEVHGDDEARDGDCGEGVRALPGVGRDGGRAGGGRMGR